MVTLIHRASPSCYRSAPLASRMASQEKSGCRSPSQSSSSSIETLDVSELVVSVNQRNSTVKGSKLILTFNFVNCLQASLESSEIYETEEIKEEQQEAAEESEAEELEEPIPDLPQYHISLEIHSTDTWSTHYTSQELSNKRYTPQDPEVPIEYYLVPMSVILCTGMFCSSTLLAYPSSSESSLSPNFKSWSTSFILTHFFTNSWLRPYNPV